MAIDLHGAEVLRLQNRTVPVTVGAASVVGLVGAAPNARRAVAASLVVGEGASAIRVTADTAGVAGNGISVAVVAGAATATRALGAAYSAATKRITVTLGRASGASSGTAAQAVTAINGIAGKIFTAVAAGAGTGTMVAAPAANLAGGADDPAPLDTPILINTQAAAAVFGAGGSLPLAIADVWRTSGRFGATIVAVRVADDTAAKIVGARGAGTGIYALLRSESRTGQRPRLIAAPGAQDDTVSTALETVAEDLRGIGVVTIDAASASAAISAKHGSHLYAVWPKIRILDAAAGGEVDRPADGLVIGHIVRVDREEGWQASPSNRRMWDVIRPSVVVDWALDSRTATANLLSRAHIATLIRRRTAPYLWGNRLLDGELISHRRVRALVGDALLHWIADWIDRNVDVPFVEHVTGRLNGFLRTQTLRRRISGGRAWFDPEFNTVDTLGANQVTFSFEIGLYGVAEQMTFRQAVSDVYNERLIAELTQA